MFAVVNDVAGCKLGSSTGPDCKVLGCAFAVIGDGFKPRLVEGEELSETTTSACAARYQDVKAKRISECPIRSGTEAKWLERLTT